MRLWNEKIQKLMSLKITITIQLIRIVCNRDGGAWGAIMATTLQECYKPMSCWCPNDAAIPKRQPYNKVPFYHYFIYCNERIYLFIN